MGDDADNGAVLLHLSEILFDLLLSVLGGPLLGVLGEGLLLGRVPEREYIKYEDEVDALR